MATASKRARSDSGISLAALRIVYESLKNAHIDDRVTIDPQVLNNFSDSYMDLMTSFQPATKRQKLTPTDGSDEKTTSKTDTAFTSKAHSESTTTTTTKDENDTEPSKKEKSSKHHHHLQNGDDNGSKKTSSKKKKKSSSNQSNEGSDDKKKSTEKFGCICGYKCSTPQQGGTHRSNCNHAKELFHFPICICDWKAYPTVQEWHRAVETDGLESIHKNTKIHTQKCSLHNKAMKKIRDDLQLLVLNPHKIIKDYQLEIDPSESAPGLIQVINEDKTYGCIGCWKIFPSVQLLQEHTDECSDFLTTFCDIGKEMVRSVYGSYIKPLMPSLVDYASDSDFAKFIVEEDDGKGTAIQVLKPYGQEDEGNTVDNGGLKESASDLPPIQLPPAPSPIPQNPNPQPPVQKQQQIKPPSAPVTTPSTTQKPPSQSANPNYKPQVVAGKSPPSSSSSTSSIISGSQLKTQTLSTTQIRSQQTNNKTTTTLPNSTSTKGYNNFRDATFNFEDDPIQESDSQ